MSPCLRGSCSEGVARVRCGIRGGRQLARGADRGRARVLAAHRGRAAPRESRARSERPDAAVRRRADDCRGAAAHGRRSRAARPRGDRRHAHGGAAARPPSRGRDGRSSLAPRPPRSRRCRSRCSRDRADTTPNVRTPERSRTIRTTRPICTPSAAGGCERWASSRRCRPTMWRRGSGRTACGGSGWRAARIRVRCVPAVPEERFEQALDLEWPIEGLEPLSFVLGRLLEPLAAHLERRGRGAAVLHVRLHLVDARRCTSGRCSCRRRSATRGRCARWRCSISNRIRPPPPSIAWSSPSIRRPARIVQFSLLTRPLPSPEQLSTLMARLQALMGEDALRLAGAVDSWEPGAFAMKPFAPVDANAIHATSHGDTEARNLELDPESDLRVSVSPWLVAARCRASSRGAAPLPFPGAARVRVEDGKPARVTIDRRGMSGGRVETCAGPWRTSGGVVERATAGPSARRRREWDRDEWDVTLTDGATYRMFRERDTDAVVSSRGSLTESTPTRHREPCAVTANCLLPTARCVHRTPRRVGLQLSAGRVAARNARRARGGARLSRAGAARCRRRVRRAALSKAAKQAGLTRDHRRGTDDRQRATGSSAAGRSDCKRDHCRLAGSPTCRVHLATARPRRQRRRATGISAAS